jgi:hypothetical protein
MVVCGAKRWIVDVPELEYMNKLIIRLPSPPRVCAALLVIMATYGSGIGSAASASGPSRSADLILAQNTVQEKAPPPTIPAPAAAPSAALTWTFAAPQPADGAGWTVERGTMTMGEGMASLRPDANRRVVLVSPPGLPEAARYAEEFVIGVSGTGLERVRVLARRDPRGGWITIADASGAALHEAADGYLVKRNAGARGAPIERLRFELQFRTTNPRALTRIATR